ncbi:hypothetical protein [Streptomyces sp. NPDC051561]|uniref:hypothetical protein n=1 Tax=Streptomyces sp. NPDC051561 TaxID=3365658 RepID=UPI0037AFB2A4
MSEPLRPSSHDPAIEAAFGKPVGELHRQAAAGNAPQPQARVMELRGLLAVAEMHVERIRSRVHQATSPERAAEDEDAETLRWDAQWLDAALSARKGCRTVLTNALRTASGQHTDTATAAHSTLPQLSADPVLGGNDAAPGQQEHTTAAHHTADEFRHRIEILYATPLNELKSQVEESRTETLLGGLLTMHTALHFAEVGVDVQLDRLREHLDAATPAPDLPRIGHLRDSADRLAQAVATRDAHRTALAAVLAGLRRADAPALKTTTAPSLTLPPVPARSR